MRTAAIALEGVLRKPLDVEAQDFGASLLYAALADQFRLVVLGTQDLAKDEHFLRINGMTRHVKLDMLRPSDGIDHSAQIRQQLRRLRAEGYRFEFVVVPDPGLARDLYRTGVPVLVYLNPVFSDGVHRPDQGGIRPWNELAAEVEFQLSAKAEMKDRT